MGAALYETAVFFVFLMWLWCMACDTDRKFFGKQQHFVPVINKTDLMFSKTTIVCINGDSLHGCTEKKRRHSENSPISIFQKTKITALISEGYQRLTTALGSNVPSHPGFISSQASSWLDLGASVPCKTFPVSVWITLTGSSLIWLLSSMGCGTNTTTQRGKVWQIKINSCWSNFEQNKTSQFSKYVLRVWHSLLKILFIRAPYDRKAHTHKLI